MRRLQRAWHRVFGHGGNFFWVDTENVMFSRFACLCELRPGDKARAMFP